MPHRARHAPFSHGRLASTVPGISEQRLHLDPDTRYAVHVYAKGRQNSRERWDEALARDDYEAMENEKYEEYLAVFVPAGTGG